MSENKPQRRKTIGVLIRFARENAGRSYRDCAAYLGFSRSRLSKFEEGVLEPTLVELEILAHYFNIPVQNLLDETAVGNMTTVHDGLTLGEVARVRTLIIGTRLRQARLQRKEPLKITSEAIGVSAGRLKNYELGRRPIPITTLETLCGYLEITLASLLDIGVGSLGEAQLRNAQAQDFIHLPADIRDFVTDKESLPYLRTAMRLRHLPTQELRDAGSALLNLTELAD